MAKAKQTKASDFSEAASAASTDALKKGFEQMMSFGGNYGEMGRTGAQALSQSAKAAGKGFEAINTQAFGFMKDTMEANMEASRTLMGMKSFGDVTQFQTEFAKTSVQSYVDQMNQMANLFATTMRETVEPLSAQAGTFAETFQGAKPGA